VRHGAPSVSLHLVSGLGPGAKSCLRKRRARRNPDGLVLFIGTMLATGAERGARERIHPQGGDVVRSSTPELGTLVNEVVFCDQAEHRPSGRDL
jgi:fumarylacetoacetate (FAA) hydrolase family protein